MITTLQICIVAVCLLFLAMVFKQVSSGRMLIKYSLLWIVLVVILALICIFPEPVYFVAGLMGFEVPANGLFAAAFFFLAAVCVSLTTIVSKQSSRINALIQDQALLEKRIGELEERDSQKEGVCNNEDGRQ